MFKDKKISDLTVKNLLWVFVFIATLILIVTRMDEVADILRLVYKLLSPFIMAIGLAFIFNIPLSYFLKKLPTSIKKGRKAIAVILALICVVGVLLFVVLVVSPQVIESIKTLVENMPDYINSSVAFVEEILEKENVSKDAINNTMNFLKQFESNALALLETLLPKLISATSNIVSFVTRFVMSIVIAIYMTISKDKLCGHVKRVCYAFLNDKQYQKLLEVMELTNTTFRSFFSGQLIEAIIIGVLCYIGCVILRIEYAPILGVLIGCTNVIPIFGPIIGTGIGALLLLFVNPIQSIIFIIFGTALQQFESNLIYPRVVGTSVGLSGLWTLAAVSIGGGLFGVMGMVLGLPTFAVIYRLFANEVNRRANIKQNRKVIEKDEVC